MLGILYKLDPLVISRRYSQVVLLKRLPEARDEVLRLQVPHRHEGLRVGERMGATHGDREDLLLEPPLSSYKMESL